MPKKTMAPPKLTAEQIESILNRVVPLIAAPEDQEFFRGVLRIKAEELSAARFAELMARIIAKAREKNALPVDTVPPVA